ncbi:MAG TPA: STAS domain-containing protein [Bryobacteraceae bacterium]|nr:STAS domain-containing protein [Candidatus Saccharimonadales bacterium]HVY94599.1 STAS domain-containing protein [Bryobacteraceae bacterium]
MAASLTIRLVEDVTVVDATGRIVMGDSASALKDLLRRLTDEGNRKIVVNLAGVTFMDTAGIGEVVGCYVSASRQGTKIKICEVTRRISDLLQVTRLNTVLDLYQWEEDALRSFRQAR